MIATDRADAGDHNGRIDQRRTLITTGLGVGVAALALGLARPALDPSAVATIDVADGTAVTTELPEGVEMVLADDGLPASVSGWMSVDIRSSPES